MKLFRRWLAAALLAAASLTCASALPASTSFAELRIDASELEIPERSISVSLYRRDENGLFQPEDDTQQFQCKLNRASQDASFFLQSSTEGVWVSVDYLTDVNNDGVYELLEDLDAPVWDVMDAQGNLAPQEEEAGPAALEPGQPYILSPGALMERSQQAVQDRIAGGGCPLDVGQDPDLEPGLPLCMIRLHCTSPDDGLDYEQTYYVQISDNVRMASDVSPSDWYYDAVDFVLTRGYFTGSSNGRFLPEGQLSRAQLAQVLWAMSGYPEVQEEAQFPDVDSSDWFCQAASWCQQEALISGYASGLFAPDDLLTREQLAAVLYRYAQRSGISLRTSADLAQFSDGADTAQWAAESMRWVMTYNLFPIEDNALRPAAVVTRAELASALYAYATNFETYNVQK